MIHPNYIHPIHYPLHNDRLTHTSDLCCGAQLTWSVCVRVCAVFSSAVFLCRRSGVCVQTVYVVRFWPSFVCMCVCICVCVLVCEDLSQMP